MTARTALQQCLEWYDSKPVTDTWQTMATLSAAGHYLALDVPPEFSAWARKVWADARTALADEAAAPALGAALVERAFPILQRSGLKYARPHPTRIPWSIADKAYSSYRARYGSGQSLERIAERGGFDPEEMDEYCPGWIEECSKVARLEAEVRRLTEARGPEAKGS